MSRWVYEAKCETEDQYSSVERSVMFYEFLRVLHEGKGSSRFRKLQTIIYEEYPELLPIPALPFTVLDDLQFRYSENAHGYSALQRAIAAFVRKSKCRSRRYTASHTMEALESNKHEDKLLEHVELVFKGCSKPIIFPDHQANPRHPKITFGPFAPDMVILGIPGCSGLIVEADGDCHTDKWFKDALSESFYRAYGFEVLRYHNEDIKSRGWLIANHITKLVNGKPWREDQRLDRHLQDRGVIQKNLAKIYIWNIAIWMTLEEVGQALIADGHPDTIALKIAWKAFRYHSNLRDIRKRIRKKARQAVGGHEYR